MPSAAGRRAFLGIVIICAAAPALRAEEPAIDGRKQARATRLASGMSIRLDGRLDEEAWRRAGPITEFVQAAVEPNRRARRETGGARLLAPVDDGLLRPESGDAGTDDEETDERTPTCDRRHLRIQI